MTDPRPSWADYFLGVATAVARRADCTRRQVGAMIVDKDNRIVSTGYNGAPAGKRGCLSANACPRGKHFAVPAFEGDDEPGICRTCETDWPCDLAAAPGSSYDTGPGACIALHAEANALLYAFRSVKGMTMYITDEPCDGCLRLIQGARIRRVVTPTSEFIYSLAWMHDPDSPASGWPHRAVPDQRIHREVHRVQPVAVRRRLQGVGARVRVPR